MSKHLDYIQNQRLVLLKSYHNVKVTWEWTLVCVFALLPLQKAIHLVFPSEPNFGAKTISLARNNKQKIGPSTGH